MATKTEFRRAILPSETTGEVAACLQQRLVDMIDLSLQLKQAHWCVVGNNFRSVHLQLDEILVTTREASDEVAERLATLGVAPDGRAKTVAEASTLATMPSEFASTSNAVTAVADRLQTTVDGLRESIAKLGRIDPVSEDMLIGISAALEKHLWMVQSQEL